MRRRPSIVLAGPLCAGKTTIALALAERGWVRVSARSAIAAAVGADGELSRNKLIEAGAELERTRPGLWLAEFARRSDLPVVVDSIRTAAQREAAVDLLRPVHLVGVLADVASRRQRFQERGDVADASANFDLVSDSPAENEAVTIARSLPIVIDTSRLTVADALDALLTALPTT